MKNKNIFAFVISIYLALYIGMFYSPNTCHTKVNNQQKEKNVSTQKKEITEDERTTEDMNYDEVSRGDFARAEIKDKIITKISQRDEEFGEKTPEETKSDISDCIIEESVKNDVDPLLIASIIDVESKFRIHELSNSGALGIMQIMPATARYIADKMHILNFDLNNYKDSIKMGTYYYASECVYAWSFEEIGQKDPKTGKTLDKYQMALMTYNGNTKTARRLSNIEYMYLVEESFESFNK